MCHHMDERAMETAELIEHGDAEEDPELPEESEEPVTVPADN